MATTKGLETNLVDLLNSLIELDFDAIEAYKAAIARMDDMSDRAALARFLEDHERHVADLTPLVVRHGGAPATGGDMKQILTKGKVVLSGLVGDRVVMAAMKTNEDDTNTAYERAVAHPQADAETLVVLERNLGDERRHREWIQQRIAQSEGVSLKQTG